MGLKSEINSVENMPTITGIQNLTPGIWRVMSVASELRYMIVVKTPVFDPVSKVWEGVFIVRMEHRMECWSAIGINWNGCSFARTTPGFKITFEQTA